jgi:hypothetical protein
MNRPRLIYRTHTSRPGQWITAASWGLQVLSWGAATLVIAGYTGVVRRTQATRQNKFSD